MQSFSEAKVNHFLLVFFRMKSLKYLNKFLWKYRYRLLLGIIFIIISNIFAIYPAQFVREAFDSAREGLKAYHALGTETAKASLKTELVHGALIFGGLILLMAVLKGFFTFLTRQTVIMVSRFIEYDLKNDVFNHYQALSPTFYKKNNTGDIMNRISEDVTKVRMYLGPGIMYTINLLVLFTLIIITMVNINLKLTLYVLIPLPVLSLIIYWVSSKINRKSEEVQRQQSFLSTFAQETFSGIRIIKSFNKEKQTLNGYEKESDNYKKTSLELVKINAFFHPSMILLIGLSTIFTIYIGGRQVIFGNGEVTYGILAEFVIYVNMLTWPVASLGWVTSMIQRAAASQKRINEFMQTKPDIINPTNEDTPVQGEITFQNVDFTYPSSGIQALKDISFNVKPNETLAIVGRTGSGKSTIANLICRLYDTTGGEVMIDGENIKNINLNQLRSQIGYVPQEVFLFSESIAENIAFGFSKEKPERALVEQAAKDAVIYKNIEGFSKGFETMLGERGITLSGGQQQRLSIARAIIHKPKILIFDDCLSAIDTKTEERILHNLKDIMAKKTSIIISHRISTVKNADKIIVLSEGSIAEQGNHESLINKKGVYFSMHQKQLLEEQKAD